MAKTWFNPRQKSDKSVTIKMTGEQLFALQFASKKLNMTQSNLIRTAINDYLVKHI